MQVFPDLQLNLTREPCTGYKQASRDQLYNSDEYHLWHNAKEPSLLFISGGTQWFGRRQTGLRHCWLSPFTIYLAEDASRDRNAIVTFFSVLPDIYSESIPSRTVIASIILQLLQRFPRILREKDDEFRRVLTRRADKAWSSEPLMDILGQVLSQIDGSDEAIPKTVYIVIDRLDLCNPNKSLSKDMASLLRMVTTLGTPSVTIKVVVVVETTEQNADWHSSLLPELEFDPHRLVERREWNQERLLNWQSHAASRPLIWRPTYKLDESSTYLDDPAYQWAGL